MHAAAGTPSGYASDLSTIWGTAPLAGAAEAIGAQAFGASAGDVVRVLVSVSAIGVLVTSAGVALGAALRTLRALAGMGGLPPTLMRRSRRCGVEPGAVVLLVVLSAALMLAVSLLGREVDALASVYSFGILIAFMLVFASVVVLRVREPSLPRVVRMGGNVRFGSSDIPVLALLGLAMSWALWVLALGTHRAGRILPPIWLAVGLLVFVVHAAPAGPAAAQAHRDGRAAAARGHRHAVRHDPRAAQGARADRGGDARDRMQARPGAGRARARRERRGGPARAAARRPDPGQRTRRRPGSGS